MPTSALTVRMHRECDNKFFSEVNFSHRIERFNFGPHVWGLVTPLAGVTEVAPEGSAQTLNGHRTFSSFRQHALPVLHQSGTDSHPPFRAIRRLHAHLSVLGDFLGKRQASSCCTMHMSFRRRTRARSVASCSCTNSPLL